MGMKVISRVRPVQDKMFLENGIRMRMNNKVMC